MNMKKTTDLVSVIMPAYNAEKYIKSAIESVLKQTYSHYEIIVVNDASSDQTAAVVMSIKDKRIKIISHENNQGPGAARNTAMDCAEGKWMALLDADDQWHPQRLELLLPVAFEMGEEYFLADKRVLCYETAAGLTPCFNNKSDYKTLLKTKGSTVLDLSEYIRHKCPPMCPIIPLKPIRDLNLRYNTHSRLGEDIEFYFHLFLNKLRLIFYPETFYYYRVTKGSLTKRFEIARDFISVYERLQKVNGFDQDVYEHFADRLKYISREIEIIDFMLKLKSAEVIKILITAYGDPGLVKEFLKRIPGWVKKQMMAKYYGSK